MNISLLSRLLRDAVSEQPNIFNYQDFECYQEKIIKHATVLHFDRNDEPIGILAFYHNDPKKKIAHITFIYINKYFRGMGLAKSLILFAIKISQSEGFDKITIETRNKNTNALKLYQKMGFLIYKKGSATTHLELDLKKNA